MADVIREFLVSLGYSVDKKSETDFKRSTREAVVQAKLLADAIEGAARTLMQGFAQMAQGFSVLEYQAERTKNSVQGLRNVAYAFQQIGLTAEDASSVLEGFASKLRENPSMKNYLERLGVDTKGKQQFEDVIGLVDRLKKTYGSKGDFGYTNASAIASQFGIQEKVFYQLWNNLDETKRRLAKGQKIDDLLGFDPDKAAKDWREFMRSMNDTGKIFQDILQKAFSDNAPTIQKKLEEFNNWLMAHGKEIGDDITKIGTAVAAAAGDFGKLAAQLAPVIDAIDRLIQKLTGERGLTVAIEAAFGLAALSKIRSFLGLLGGGAASGSFWSFLGPLAAGVGLTAWGAQTYKERSAAGLIETPEQRERQRAFEERRQKNKSWARRAWNTVTSWFGGSTNDINPDEAGKPLSSSRRDRNAAETYRILRAAGLSREAALGIVGNEQQESGFDPSVTGDGGLAKGSFQWHPDRQAAILNGTGIDVTDPSTSHGDHIRAALWEMQHSNDAGARKAWELLQDAQSPSEAAAIFSNYFERPRDKAGQARVRGINANTWATRLSDAKGNGSRLNLRALHPAFDWAKNADANLGAINSGAPLGGNLTNSSQVTIAPSSTTHIVVNGATDPAATANAIESKQNGVNSMLLRNAQGSVR